MIILLLFLKLAPPASVSKTKSFINCFRNPSSTCATENWKHNSGKQRTINCFLKPIYRSGVKLSAGKVIPHTNLGRQETPCPLTVPIPHQVSLIIILNCNALHLDISNSDWWAAAAARVCRTLLVAVEAHWKNSHSFSNEPFIIYTVHQHDVDDPTTRNSDQGKAWPPNTPGAREAEEQFSRIGRTNAL